MDIKMENNWQYKKLEMELQKLPLAITNYFNNIRELFENYLRFYRTTYDSTFNKSEIISDTIPASGYDIFNYIAKYGLANFQIQFVMRLDGRLNFDRLVKAVRLSFDAEPIFGSRFVYSNPPYWKRFDNIDNIKFCKLTETDNTDEAISQFLERTMDMDNDPMVMIELIRSGQYDTLGLKINHVCCDGVGAKEYIKLLSDTYNRISEEDGVFIPQPSVRDNKDHNCLKDTINKFNPMTSYTPLQQIPLTTWSFPWKNIKIGDTGFEMCRLPEGCLDLLKVYSKARGATINDLLLTAIYRAMFEISKPPYGLPMDISITSDLRRYLPENKAQAIRNFSSGAIFRIGRKANELFEETLSRVMVLTKDFKSRHPSFASIIGVEKFEKISFYQICACFRVMSQAVELVSQNPIFVFNRCSPVLSNIGFISKSLIKFGDNTVTDLYCIPPAVRAPGILIVSSTYNDIITLAIGYYKPSVQKKDIEELLNKIRDELIQSCSY